VPHVENRYAGTASGFDHSTDLRRNHGAVADVGQYSHLGVVDQHVHPERTLHGGDGATPAPNAAEPVERPYGSSDQPHCWSRFSRSEDQPRNRQR
jgi:hypothetical protein